MNIRNKKRQMFVTAIMLLFAAVMNLSAQVVDTPKAHTQWVTVADDKPSAMKTQLLFSSEESVKVRVTVAGFYQTAVTTPRGEASVITVPRAANNALAGEPDVPMTSVPVMIGYHARMNVRVLEARYKDFDHVAVAPSKGSILRSVDPATVPYTYGDCYQQNAFFPANNAALYAPYIVRECRGQNIALHPFVYNPVTQTLRVYYDMTIEMYKEDNMGQNVMNSRRARQVKAISQDFRNIYNRHFINYGQQPVSRRANSTVEEEGDLLIICADQFMEDMEEFVNWKKTRGVNTTLVSVTEVGGANQKNIKEYITNRYNDSEGKLTHVLFVGDDVHIPGYNFGSWKGDHPYGQLEGDDIYNEVIVGRFSANTSEEVTTQVERVMYYERDLQDDATWLQRGQGIGYIGAGLGHYNEDDYQHIDHIRDTLLHYGYTEVSQRHGGGGGASRSNISSDINEGVGIINYCNHGGETGWGVANFSNDCVTALTNMNKLPFIISTACLVGRYDYNGGDCFAEKWMHATDEDGKPTGAIGCLMAYISQPWTPPMYGQDEINDILTEQYDDNIKHTWGGVVANGLISILDHCGDDNSAVETYQSWILYGDPTMMVRTKTPQEMNVSHEQVIVHSASSFMVTASNGNGALATITDAEYNILGRATIVNGLADITLDRPLTPGEELTLCVYGYNKVTYLQTIKVIANGKPYVSLQGNSPTFPHVGSDADLTLTFKNVGVEDLAGTTMVTLSSSDSLATIVSDTGQFDSLAVGETATIDSFRISVPDSLADGTVLMLRYLAKNGDMTWEGTFPVTAAKAVMEYQGLNGSSTFEPGSETILKVKYKNIGHYQATKASVTITSDSEYVTIVNTMVEVDTIAAGEEITAEFHVIIADDCPVAEKLPLTFTMTADDDISVQGTETLKNTAGVVFDLSDSYGDGWTGGKLEVGFSDGTPSKEITLETGSQATNRLNIALGTHVTLTWHQGKYNRECSFKVSYEGGEVIYQTSNPKSGLLFEFDCNAPQGIQTYTVSVASNSSEMGSVIGGGSYQSGDTCTVYATANDGFSFNGWLIDDNVVCTENQYEFQVDRDVSLVADFSPIVMLGEHIVLSDDAKDNSTVIETNNGKAVRITLDGRTIHTDDDWNTLCLPFTLTTLKGTPLNGFTVMELDTSSDSYAHVTGVDNGTLYLNFKRATGIEAGKPYLVKKLDTTPTDRTIPTYTATDGTTAGSDDQHRFLNLVDGNAKTCWNADITDGRAYCEFHTPKPVQVTGYTLTTGNQKSVADPTVWTLKAKLHENDPWTDIDSRNVHDNANDALPTARTASKDYKIPTDEQGAYQYFRFEAAQSENNAVSLAELAMLGYYAGEPKNIESPEFEDVVVNSQAPGNHAVAFTGGRFVGSFDYIQYPASDNSILFLGANNTLYYPQADQTDANHTDYPHQGAFRACFELSEPNTVKSFVLNFESGNGVPTSLGSNSIIVSPVWQGSCVYTLDGRKIANCQLSTVNSQLKKGIYIMNGKKVAVK